MAPFFAPFTGEKGPMKRGGALGAKGRQVWPRVCKIGPAEGTAGVLNSRMGRVFSFVVIFL